MDYEKAYKYALERARNLHKDAIDMEESLLAKQCEIIFPELKESDDEKIRKELIEFVEIVADWQSNKKEWLAWLEKQGEKDNWAEELNTKIKELHKQCLEKIQENMPTIVWHSVSEEPEEMKELFCEWESDDATWHDVAFYDEESHTFRHAKMPINVTKWVYVDELLKKQVEQKPIDKVEPKFKVGDMVCKKKDSSLCATINSITDTVYLCDIFDSEGDYDDDYAFLISEQDEYELVAKRIEPKFHKKMNAIKI